LYFFLFKEKVMSNIFKYACEDLRSIKKDAIGAAFGAAAVLIVGGYDCDQDYTVKSSEIVGIVPR